MGLRIGDEPVPNYRLVRFLGRGGFGQVWAATSPGGIHVALKIIDLSGREGVKEFKALRLMKSIRQANLTPILAFWLKDEDGQLVDESQVGNDLSSNVQPQTVQGTVLINSLSKMRPDELIIAMGLGDKTLSDRLRECNEIGLVGIPPEELFNYMIDAARAIDFLNTPRHDLGHGPISPIQHCDIKPQNILIVGDTAQVCDFGLARELGTNVKMTSAAVSPAYGAPELIEGRPPSGATDQYSLAITYVELRTGGLPFADPDSYLHVVNAHLYGGLDLTGLSVDEQDVIRKATSREPADRFESALKMVKALRLACPDDAGSIRVMPSQSRQNTGSQVGSDLNVTMPFPGGGTGHSTMPVPLIPQISSGLTETPGARVGVTKVDSRLAKTTTHLDEAVETEEQRLVRHRRARIWKTVAALIVLGGLVGAGVYVARPSDPKYLAQIAALQDINSGEREKDLFKRAGFFMDAYKSCQRYASDPLIADTMKEADSGLKVTWEKVEEEAQGQLGQTSQDDARVEALLKGIAYYDRYRGEFKGAPGFTPIEDARERLAAQASALLVERGEQLLMPPDNDEAGLKTAAESFDKVVELLQDDHEESQFRAKLGTARIAARRDRHSTETAERLYGLLSELRAEGTYNPLWEAQIHVLLSLAARETHPKDPAPALKALEELQAGGMRLLKNPESGGAEASQVDTLLAWASASPALTEKDRDILRNLEATGTRQSLDDARGKLQAVLASQDPKARQVAVDALRESAKRGIASNDPQTKRDFDELRYLADALDPQAPATDVTVAIAWFKSVPPDQQIRLSQWVAALVTLADRAPVHLGSVIEALEAHAGDANALDKLPKLYQQRIVQLVTEPTAVQDYFAQLATTCDRLRKLSGDDRLSNLARAESLHAQHAGKPTLAAQHETIRGLLATAGRQSEVPEQAMYEKFVRVLVRDEPLMLSDADRSELQELVKFASQDPPGYAFAVNARREELSRLLIRAAAGVRAGADGHLGLEAIAHPYGEGDAGSRQAYAFLDGVKSLTSKSVQDPQFQANALLASWYMGPTGRQLVVEKRRQVLKDLARNTSLTDHDRLPLLYLRVQLPIDASDVADRTDAMDAMCTLFEALNKAEVAFDDARVLALAKQAESWIDEAKDPRPTDEALKKQLARLAYDTERLLVHYKRDGYVSRKAERYKAYSLAVELDGKNSGYLAARGFASLDFDPPLMKEALADAKLLQELTPDSAASQGLMAYVKLEQSRREVDPALRAELAAEAVTAGEAASAATTDQNDLATFLLHLGDSYVAWANYGPKDGVVQAARLREAIDRVNKAKQLPGLVYEDYANIILGNAYEDLAWLAKVGSEKDINDNYDRAISAFKEVAQAYPALGLMNLGRCYYKREVDSRQVGQGYLTEAKTALEGALQKKSGYADAYRWLGAVHEAQENYEFALTNYAQAAELAKQQKSYNFPYYIRYWARVALKGKEAPAPLRAQLLGLLNDPDLQAAEVHKELALRVGMTYEKENKWPEAIEQYTKEIGGNPTPLDVDLLRSRALASAHQAIAKGQKNEPALHEYRDYALDWDQVILLTGAESTWFDLYQQAIANQTYWLAARSSGNVAALVALEKSIKAYDAAVGRIEKLPKAIPTDKSKEAQAVFNQYVILLSDAAFRSDFPRLTAVGRKLVKDAPARLGKAAGKVSNTFQSRVMRELLTPELRQGIDKL